MTPTEQRCFELFGAPNSEVAQDDLFRRFPKERERFQSKYDEVYWEVAAANATKYATGGMLGPPPEHFTEMQAILDAWQASEPEYWAEYKTAIKNFQALWDWETAQESTTTEKP